MGLSIRSGIFAVSVIILVSLISSSRVKSEDVFSIECTEEKCLVSVDVNVKRSITTSKKSLEYALSIVRVCTNLELDYQRIVERYLAVFENGGGLIDMPQKILNDFHSDSYNKMYEDLSLDSQDKLTEIALTVMVNEPEDAVVYGVNAGTACYAQFGIHLKAYDVAVKK